MGKGGSVWLYLLRDIEQNAFVTSTFSKTIT